VFFDTHSAVAKTLGFVELKTAEIGEDFCTGRQLLFAKKAPP
jgi:hypothetical protein